ncbi:MAG: IPT/TIG domain-containing protein [Candidatus Aminicenantes bacterium]|nr:MAG: IPT/TIG domain-containing protein [Candidatus Aminicenantes bacterium]
MFKKNVYVISVPVFFFLGLIAIMTFTACNAMTLTSTSPTRGTSGDIFTIYGSNMGSSQGSKTPSINRGRAYFLEVLSWSSTEVRVRIPPGLPAGNYKVLIYYDDTYRTGSNSLDFLVTDA